MHHSETEFGRSARWEPDHTLHHLSPARAEWLAQIGGTGLPKKKQRAFDRLTASLKNLHLSTQRNNAGFCSVLAGAALLLGLIQIHDSTLRQHIDDTAEIDAMVLSDELPLSAYLETGFNHFADEHDAE